MTESEDIDERYRSASAANLSRPPESVRNAVLLEAARLAAQRERELQAGRRWHWREDRRPVLFGALAAALLAGILVIPRLLRSDAPRMAATQIDTAAAPSPAAPRAPTPEAQRADAMPPAVAMQPSAKGPGESRFGDSPPTERTDSASTATAESAAGAPRAAVADARAGRTDQAMANQAAQRIDAGGALRSAAATGNVEAVNALLDGFADVNSRDEKGRTALMLAILSAERACVEALLARGADANAADGEGMTPLQAALRARQSAMAQALRAAGAH